MEAFIEHIVGPMNTRVLHYPSQLRNEVSVLNRLVFHWIDMGGTRNSFLVTVKAPERRLRLEIPASGRQTWL